ncbi:MAG: hypothetical protein Q9222_006153 [Ikaeria aurantiellina]
MLTAIPPAVGSSKDLGKGTRINPEVSRDEREALWAGLPQTHISALGILEQIILRLETNSMALDRQLLNHVLETFASERSNVAVRTTVYRVLAQMLPHCRAGVHNAVVSSIARCLNKCCDDLVHVPAETDLSRFNGASTTTNESQTATNTDAYLEASKTSLSPSSGAPTEVQQAAEDLLSSALTNLPHDLLGYTIRSKIDQTAILAQSKLLLKSSVLNPPTRNVERNDQEQSSILPFLARCFSQDQDAESLLRPRMPPVQSNVAEQTNGLYQESDEHEDGVEGFPSSSPGLAPIRLDGPDAFVNEVGDQGMRAFQDPVRDPATEAEDSAPYVTITQQTATPSAESTERHQMPEDIISVGQGGSKRPLEFENEHSSKRMRSGESDTAFPHRNDIEMLRQDMGSPLVTVPVPTDPLPTVHKVEKDIDDDDSDESSVPEIDLTMPSEDEEDED